MFKRDHESFRPQMAIVPGKELTMSFPNEFQDKRYLEISESPNSQLNYVKKQRYHHSEKLFCWLKAKNLVFIKLSNVSDHLTRIKIINSLFPGNTFKLHEKLPSRISKLIARKCYNVMQEVKTLNRKGTKKEREKFQGDCTMFSIQFGDIIRASEWEEEITTLSGENENWKLKYKNLENEKKKLFHEMSQEIQESKEKELSARKEQDILLEENESLKHYIRKLEREEMIQEKGVTAIPELKSSQARNRRLKELKTRAQKALYFINKFGLEIESLGLRSCNGEDRYKLQFTAKASSKSPDWYF